MKVWKSDLLAPGLKDAGDDEEAWGANEFGDAGVKTLDEDMDEAGVEDWQEAEGGGLAVDTRLRDEKAAKIEASLVYCYDCVLTCSADHVLSGQEWLQVSLAVSLQASMTHFNSGIDHHRHDSVFATASNTVQIWDETK